MSNRWHIHANEIEVDAREDEDCVLVCLWERRPESIRYLALSNSLDSDSEPYVERDDQGWSCSGGITRAAIEDSFLELELSPASAASLGGVSTLRVDFPEDIEASILEELQTALASILHVAALKG